MTSTTAGHTELLQADTQSQGYDNMLSESTVQCHLKLILVASKGLVEFHYIREASPQLEPMDRQDSNREPAFCS